LIKGNVQQTEFEKLADGFKLAGFTQVDRLKNSSNPWQTISMFSALNLFIYSPLKYDENLIVRG